MVRFLFTFYLGITAFFLLVIELTSITLMTGALAITALWILYLALLIGYSSVGRRYSSHYSSLELNFYWVFKSSKSAFMYGLFSLILSIICMRYYTGLWPMNAYLLWAESNSVYHSYQEYYGNSVAGVSVVSKLPYILGQAVVFLMFLIAALAYRIDTVIPKSTKRIFLFLCTVSYLYMGFARGTNFEIFTATSVLGFILLSRRNKSIKSLMVFIPIVFFAIFLFDFSLSLRGWINDDYITADVFLEKDSLIYMSFPWLATIIILLYGYFGHGLNFIGNFFSNVMLDDYSGLIWLLPRPDLFFNASAVENTEAFVSMGIRWVPGMIAFIEVVGLVGIVLLCYGFGVIARIGNNVGSVNGQILQFIVAFVMISFPLGSFFGISYIVLAGLFSAMIILARISRV